MKECVVGKAQRPLVSLYISYDGILEPLGQSQVVNYLFGLASSTRQTLISFEKPADLDRTDKVCSLKAALRDAGIRWIRLTYHKRPPLLSTLWDVIVGVIASLSVCLTGRIRVVHARGYVPALIAVLLKRVAGPKFLFDMRGFWADEKVDGGHWSRASAIYSITKRCERLFFESADAIVSLTEEGAKMVHELGYAVRPGTKVEVIPTCTDLSKFTPGPKDPSLMSSLELEGHRVIGCVGSMSNWYLRQQMLEYLGFLVRHFDTLRILIVTREDHDRLRNDALKAGIPRERLILTQSDFSDMPKYMRLMDVGVFFIRVCFSKKGSAATKLGEFLACGVPVIINDGVGDSGWIVRKHDVGVVLSDTAAQEFEQSLPVVKQLFDDPGISDRCRETARQYFDLNEGIRKYAALYRDLAGVN